MFHLFFLLTLFVHIIFTPVLSCEIMHQMQSNALIFMCDASKRIPDNCIVFWQNNFLSFCISESHVDSHNNSLVNLTNYTYQNTTFDINQYIPNFDNVQEATTTTSIPTITAYTIINKENSTAVAINDSVNYNNTTKAAAVFPWVEIICACLVISLLYCAIFSIFYCVKKRRKTSILPVIGELKSSDAKLTTKRTKIIHSKIRPPSKYLLSAKSNPSLKQLSIEEVVQLKQILAKKRKKNKMKKYTRYILPPIVKGSKKIVPQKTTILKDHSWRIPPV